MFTRPNFGCINPVSHPLVVVKDDTVFRNPAGIREA